MDPIDTLTEEHRLIEKALDALEAFADKAASHSDSKDKAELSRFVVFLRDFADACHHGKEEHILFATLSEHGFSREREPLAVMLHEHDEGRSLVATLGALAEQSPAWSAEDRKRLVATAHSYASLLRRHIVKEDQILYPLARARLPGDAMASIRRRFEDFEEHETGSGEHERLHELAESLIVEHAPGMVSHREHAHGHHH